MGLVNYCLVVHWNQKILYSWHLFGFSKTMKINCYYNLLINYFYFLVAFSE